MVSPSARCRASARLWSILRRAAGVTPFTALQQGFQLVVDADQKQQRGTGDDAVSDVPRNYQLVLRNRRRNQIHGNANRENCRGRQHRGGKEQAG